MKDTRTLKQVEKAVATMRRKVAAAVKRHAKLQARISKLEAADRICWLHKDAEIVAGDNEWYVKAESLNTDKEAEWNWYYILTCDEHGYTCRCESVKPCKHITALSKSFQPTEADTKVIEQPVVTYVQEGTLFNVHREANKLVSVPAGSVELKPQEWEAWRKEMLEDMEQRTVAPLNSNQGFQLLRA